MRDGFSLILAIVFIVAISALALNTITLTSTATSITNQLYIHSQAKLIAISATQNAIAQIQRNNFDTSCPSKFILYYPDNQNYILKSQVTIKYIGGKRPSSCVDKIWHEIDTTTQNIRSAIMHTMVQTNPNLAITPIKISKITTQKP
ncbi:hypothetical protein [Campylobacter vicugnae]|uniref:hypothetical protein n=1 Tax=Campylobacter vicugnae TaxID=1660076 RepID=UPI000A34B13E|nr:hypothetical protein [Campylobacter sp. RM8970]